MDIDRTVGGEPEIFFSIEKAGTPEIERYRQDAFIDHTGVDSYTLTNTSDGMSNIFLGQGFSREAAAKISNSPAIYG